MSIEILKKIIKNSPFKFSNKIFLLILYLEIFRILIKYSNILKQKESLRILVFPDFSR